MSRWVRACAVDALALEDVLRFDHDGRTYAIYRTPSGWHATAGLCTHEEAHLADGLVMGDIIECPLHQGRFHIPSGEAKGAPVIDGLATFPTKVEDGQVFVLVP
jgi:3-phenylpropionate/trans-cinnamate dioxygenase ferredoxin component